MYTIREKSFQSNRRKGQQLNTTKSASTETAVHHWLWTAVCHVKRWVNFQEKRLKCHYSIFYSIESRFESHYSIFLTTQNRFKFHYLISQSLYNKYQSHLFLHLYSVEMHITLFHIPIILFRDTHYIISYSPLYCVKVQITWFHMSITKCRDTNHIISQSHYIV